MTARRPSRSTRRLPSRSWPPSHHVPAPTSSPTIECSRRPPHGAIWSCPSVCPHPFHFAAARSLPTHRPSPALPPAPTRGARLGQSFDARAFAVVGPTGPRCGGPRRLIAQLTNWIRDDSGPQCRLFQLPPRALQLSFSSTNGSVAALAFLPSSPTRSISEPSSSSELPEAD